MEDAISWFVVDNVPKMISVVMAAYYSLKATYSLYIGEPIAISQLQSVDYYSQASYLFPTNRVTIIPYSRL